MSESEDILIAHMKVYVEDQKIPVHGLTEELVVQAETMLGFSLPPLLRRIYLEVGEGSFGLASFYEGSCDMPLIDSYVGLRASPQIVESMTDDTILREWPEKLLLMYDWGCNIYSCLDCSQPPYRVLRHDNNRSHRIFAIEASSLEDWLQALITKTLCFDWDEAEKVKF